MGTSDCRSAHTGSPSVRVLGERAISRDGHVEVESEGRVLRALRPRVWLRADPNGIGSNARFSGAVSSELGGARRFSETRWRTELLSAGDDGLGRVQRRTHSGRHRSGLQRCIWPLRRGGLEGLFSEFDDRGAAADVVIRVADVQGPGVACFAAGEYRIVGSESGSAGGAPVQDRPSGFRRTRGFHVPQHGEFAHAVRGRSLSRGRSRELRVHGKSKLVPILSVSKRMQGA
jgi:hypothetical protein